MPRHDGHTRPLTKAARRRIARRAATRQQPETKPDPPATTKSPRGAT